MTQWADVVQPPLGRSSLTRVSIDVKADGLANNVYVCVLSHPMRDILENPNELVLTQFKRTVNAKVKVLGKSIISHVALFKAGAAFENPPASDRMVGNPSQYPSYDIVFLDPGMKTGNHVSRWQLVIPPLIIGD